MYLDHLKSRLPDIVLLAAVQPGLENLATTGHNNRECPEPLANISTLQI
jgi:hypothetical protein